MLSGATYGIRAWRDENLTIFLKARYAPGGYAAVSECLDRKKKLDRSHYTVYEYWAGEINKGPFR